jgi:putative ABC transport system permease protein
MTWVALKSLAERRTRAVLTALAIVLGVAMIAGSLILTDTIDRAFTTIFSSSYTQTDLVVRGKPVVADSMSGAPTVPAQLLPKVRALPGVAAAAGSLVDLTGTGNNAKLIGKDGKVITGDNPTFGFGVDPSQPRFNPLTLTEGSWAAGPDQMVVDVGTAKDHGFAIGDRVGVSSDGPIRTFTVTGLARFGGVDSIGGATIAVFDIPTARTVLGKTGFDAIQVATKPGVSQARVEREIAPLLPAAAEVKTGAEQAESDKAVVSEAITFIRGFLLAFGGIALFVGAFVIFNTLSITVAQRSRELATLRTLGASRRQVLRSVIAEAGIIGLAASVVGLGLGYALAKGLSAIFRAVGADMPQADTVFETRTIVVSLVVGTLITLLAGVIPAVRATRVPPIAAVREGAVPPRGRMGRLTPFIALATIGVAGALLVHGLMADGLDARERLLNFGGGTLALFIGTAMISSRLVRPIAAVVGWPIARLGGASGRLARENAVRNPTRTASTAAALMIGLALVTFVSVVGAGMLDSSRSAVTDQISADYVVTSSSGWEVVPTAVGRELSDSGVGTVSSVRRDQGLVAGSSEEVSGVDPGTIGDTYDFDWSEGSDAALSTLDSGGAILLEGFAEDHGLGVGDPVSIVTPSGTKMRRTVTGVYDPPQIAPLLGAAVISQKAFDSAFPRAKDIYSFVDAPDATPAQIEASLQQFPDSKVSTASAFAKDYSSDLEMILTLLYVLLALSVVVSLFGMVNTMILAVHERTRELGMLRAVGMTRRQARRMVRGESVITALIGAALGLPLGIAMAALVTRSLSDYGVQLVVPVGMLVVFAIVAVVAGVVAAVAPARRAGRLDVLKALQYE